MHGTERMTSQQEFRGEVCGIVTSNPTHWFVIRCGDSELTVHRWNSETANAAGARHYCGEAHAEVYISRWIEPTGRAGGYDSLSSHPIAHSFNDVRFKFQNIAGTLHDY